MRSLLSHEREDSEISGSWLWVATQRFGYVSCSLSSFPFVDCSWSKHHVIFKCPWEKEPFLPGSFLGIWTTYPETLSTLPTHLMGQDWPTCLFLFADKKVRALWLTVVCPGVGPGSQQYLSYLHHWRKLGFSEEGREGEMAVRGAANTIIWKGNVGLSWWYSGQVSTCQCRGYGFNPRSGRPHTP